MTTNVDGPATTVPPVGPEDRSRGRNPLTRILPAHVLETILLPLAWVLVIIGFGLHSPSTFLTFDNFANIFGTNATLFVMVMALLVPLTNGDLDLSVAANTGLTSMIIAWLNVNHQVAIVPAIIIGLVVAVVCGAVNGAIVVRFDVNPFIITLATGTVFDGISQWISNEQTVVGVSPQLTAWTFSRHLLSIPIEFWYGVVIMLIMWYLLTFTPFGQRSLFVGQSREVARLSGFKVGSIRFWGFVLAGLIAGIAGILEVGTQGGSTAGSADSLLLSAYAAAFLGLTTIQPGRFNAIGAGVSVYFLATGVAGLENLGAQPYVQPLFYGIVLVVAVVFSRVVRRRRAAGTAP